MHAALTIRALTLAALVRATALLLVAGGVFLGARVTAEENTKTPAEVLLGEIKTTPYSARADLKEKLRQAELRIATNMTEWNARKNNLPEKEKAAADVDIKKLVQMREVLRQKIDAVDFAEEPTWSSAKYDLYIALQNAIAVHKKLMARFST
jgi:hypothetical protein